MDTLALKIVAGATLWVLSLCFGILIPFLIWRSTSSAYRRLKQQDRTLSGELNSNENINLIGADEHDNSNCYGLQNAGKRFLSWLKVSFGKGRGLSLANCICGGVFLGVCLLDLIPQSRQDVEEILTKMGKETTFPFSEFAISIGLLLIMAAESIAIQFFIPRNHGKTERADTCTVNVNDSDLSESEIIVLRPPQTSPQNIVVYRNYILAATLSLHSIFEGLAIGLQAEFTVIMQLFIAISVHKAVLTFGIGLRLFETLGECGKIRAAVICSFIFCTASPVGCAIGTVLWKQSEMFGDVEDINPADIASALLQCLATGTFLYVTFIEVIPNEFSHEDHNQEKETPEDGASEPATPNHELPTTSYDAASARSYNTSQSNTNISVSSNNSHTHEISRMWKLLALFIGFAIASGLQCL